MSALAMFSLLLLFVVLDNADALCEPLPCTDDTQGANPVCGLDRKTYISRCDLKQKNCNKDDFAYTGACTFRENCRRKPSCPDQYKPVCVSNGITYRNKCFMFKQTCNKYPIAHEGECKPTV